MMITIIITFKKKKKVEPKVVTKPSFFRIKYGSDLIINLKTIGYPPNLFQWYRNGYKFLNQTKQASLVLNKVDFEYTGTYSCEVSNLAGKILWLEATVHVEN
jgi:hypothetical protein